jgi:SAM-dependent methyltransferase
LSFDYSDGDQVEARMLELLRGTDALGSRVRIAAEEQARSWPIRYHLSPERANLVRHLRFEGLDVLELGAGFGGLSRYLAESARHLCAVEASPVRMAGLRARLRDLEGWLGVEDRIEDVCLDRRFDVVCLVGVLEYAELFTRFKGDAFDQLLARATSFLAPDGVLLLGIENRLGLKYWSGAPEDHSGRLFDGLAGYRDAPCARTFSRRELCDRLIACGLGTSRWFYPFPDYKLPTSIVTPELIAQDSRLAVDLACTGPFETPPHGRLYLMPDYLLLDGVARAGLFAEFANSFLVLAARGPEALARLAPSSSIVACHYSAGRRVATVTELVSTPQGLASRKLRCDADARQVPMVGGGVRWTPAAPGLVARGEPLRGRLLRRLHFGDVTGFVNGLVAFASWVRDRYGEGRDQLRGEALDALFTNATCPGPGEFELFDLEWTNPDSIPLSWFVLRNVLAWYVDQVSFAHQGSFATLDELYFVLVRALDLEPARDRDIALEVALREQVLTDGARAEDLHRILARPLENAFSPPQRSEDLL